MNHSLPLHKKLYSLYKEKGLTEERREIVADFTGGRTDNSAELTTNEIVSLISSLDNSDTKKPVKRQNRTIYKLFGLCYVYGYKKYSEAKKKDVVDVTSLNNWLIKYGKFHKKLESHSDYELGIVTTQFERVVNQLLKTM